MDPSSNTSLYGANMDPLVNTSKEASRGALGIPSGRNFFHASTDASLFSSSLPVFLRENVSLNDKEGVCEAVDDIDNSYGLNDPLEDVGIHAIGSSLPDDEDELLAGIMDDLDLHGLPTSMEDLEDYDLFGGGGMELETDQQESQSFGFSNVAGDSLLGNMPQYSLSNGAATVAGEHPQGEHPSRTLFVRNINSNVEDSELRVLFEQYGDIRNLYTSCKHRGFVMISYFDIRAARTAMRALQNKPLRRRKLDIHFSIPKDNPSDKDVNQGTLVIFNLDPSVSNEDIRQIFGAFGEVKEIRETPKKRHHKFIEYYDVRAAEAALKSLNRSDIAGKRIKLEPSRPGGARRSLMLLLNQDGEPDDSQSFRHQIGSPLTNSPPGNWPLFNGSTEHGLSHNISKSPVFKTMSPTTNSHMPGLTSILHSQLSSSAKVSPIGKDTEKGNHMEHTYTNPSSAFNQSHSLPDPRLSQFHGTSASFGSTSNASGIETISAPQFLWGSPKLNSENTNSFARHSPSMGHPYLSNGQHGSFLTTSQQHHNRLQHQNHHIGSAPSVVPMERHYGFFPESLQTSYMGPVSFGGIGGGHGEGSFMINPSIRPPMSTGISVSRNMSENGSSFRMMSSPRLSPVFLGNGLYPGIMASSSMVEGFTDRSRSRRLDNNGNIVDNKKQFELQLDKIISGEESRTTLMIKNIPNKYTSKMLLNAIDENHRGTYDFLYLPIDFKNKCNVGYAFINMLSPKHIVSFYEAFDGKRWEKFNSEKIASLAFARIQGKAALASHFQNSSLMNEDKRCRPILFHTEVGEQEHLPSSNLNISASLQEGSYFGEFTGNPSIDRSGDKI